MKAKEVANQGASEQSTYEIRQAVTSDIKSIRSMQARSWQDTYVNEAKGVSKEQIKEITEQWLTADALQKSTVKLTNVFSDPQQFYRVALSGQDIVGFVHASTKDDGTKHLGALYTEKSTHGTGLGQKLMKLVDDWAQGVTIDLEVVSYNERAKAFYSKYGFIEAGPSDTAYYENMPVTIMMRRGRP